MIGPRDDPASVGAMILSGVAAGLSAVEAADRLDAEAEAARDTGIRLIPLYKDTRPSGPMCGLPARNGHVKLPEEA